MSRLTEQEQQEIIRYVEADKPLPDKYRFLLFEEKREEELVWNGKTSEVCTTVPPFQVIEQVDEPRDYIFENEWQSFRTKKIARSNSPACSTNARRDVVSWPLKWSTFSATTP